MNPIRPPSAAVGAAECCRAASANVSSPATIRCRSCSAAATAASRDLQIVRRFDAEQDVRDGHFGPVKFAPMLLEVTLDVSRPSGIAPGNAASRSAIRRFGGVRRWSGRYAAGTGPGSAIAVRAACGSVAARDRPPADGRQSRFASCRRPPGGGRSIASASRREPAATRRAPARGPFTDAVQFTLQFTSGDRVTIHGSHDRRRRHRLRLCGQLTDEPASRNRRKRRIGATNEKHETRARTDRRLGLVTGH